MLKKYLWIKNIVFFSLFSYLAAQIGNGVILSYLPDATPQEEQAGPSSPAGGSAKPRSLKSYELISSRDIFNSRHAQGDGQNAENPLMSTAPLKKTELSVKLIGTVVSAPETSFAVIEDQKAGKQELFRIDDMIQDVARVLQISRCRVVVLREGSQEILECPEDEQRRAPGGGAALSQQASPPDGGDANTVKKVSETEYLIDESEVHNALENINELITQVRVVPNFQDGKANGFKVFAIKPNSIFSKIGLKNGDVIQKINDREITTPDKAFQAFQDLRSEKSLAVEIVRRGGPQTLNYEIR